MTWILFAVAGLLGYAAVKKSQATGTQTNVTDGTRGVITNRPDFHPTSRLVSHMILSGQFQEGGPSIFNPPTKKSKGTPPSVSVGGGGGGFGGGGSGASGAGGTGGRPPKL
jgi:hypothetical protein